MALLSSGSGAAAGGAEWSAGESSNSHFARGARPDLRQTDGFCVQVRSSTLRLGAAAFLGIAVRAASCSGDSGLLLGAAPTMSLGEDNSWRSLATAAAVACVWAFFCVVGALPALAAALNTFGSSARHSGWNARLAGVLLASTASITAAAPANASVAPFSDDISRTERKLTGYVMTDSNIRTAVAVWLSDATAAEAAYGHISTWETSGVTDMSSLFCVWQGWMEDQPEYLYDSCVLSTASFNEDIGAWDTSGVTTMNFMFFAASAFNQDIGAWDTSGVKSMWSMFGLTSSFNQDIGGWAVHSVTEMQGMFFYASAFNQDIGGWRVEQVTNMHNMFQYASAFDQDLGWCVDDGVFDRYGDTIQDAFDGTRCASTCGVVQVNNLANCPTRRPTPHPTPHPTPRPTLAGALAGGAESSTEATGSSSGGGGGGDNSVMAAGAGGAAGLVLLLAAAVFFHYRRSKGSNTKQRARGGGNLEEGHDRSAIAMPPPPTGHNFCSACGAPLKGQFCVQCGARA